MSSVWATLINPRVRRFVASFNKKFRITFKVSKKTKIFLNAGNDAFYPCEIST
jgi:hypothetical protein